MTASSAYTYKSGSTESNKKKLKKEEDSDSDLPSILNSEPDSKKAKSPITCHVLDSSVGKPGAKIKIRIDQLCQTGGFMHVATGVTDEDGRNNSLLPSTLDIGKNSIFKLTLYTREYFNAKGLDTICPHVEIMCKVTEPEENCHVALILGPYSHAVYIGS